MAQVIVGVDESDGAAEALRWAAREAGLHGWTLTAVLAWGWLDQHHIVDDAPFDPGYGEKDALAALDTIVVAGARRPGAAKDLASVLPACATAARRLRKDARVPQGAKLAVAFAGLWVLSPIDLIPEFLPVIGPLDDVVVAALALRYAAWRVPRHVLFEAWPAEPRVLERLLG